MLICNGRNDEKRTGTPDACAQTGDQGVHRYGKACSVASDSGEIQPWGKSCHRQERHDGAGAGGLSVSLAHFRRPSSDGERVPVLRGELDGGNESAGRPAEDDPASVLSIAHGNKPVGAACGGGVGSFHQLRRHGHDASGASQQVQASRIDRGQRDQRAAGVGSGWGHGAPALADAGQPDETGGA